MGVATAILEESGADAKVVVTGGSTPLHVAARGRAQVVQPLVARAGNVDKMDEEGWTPFQP